MTKLLWSALLLAVGLMAQNQPQPPTITTGLNYPASGLCGSAVQTGQLYVRSENPTNGPIQVYRCTQVGATQFGWLPVGHIVVSALPATCDIGDTAFYTGATAGQNWYGCTTANTWTVMSGGSTLPASAAVLGTNSGGTAIAAALPTGDIWFGTANLPVATSLAGAGIAGAGTLSTVGNATCTSSTGSVGECPQLVTYPGTESLGSNLAPSLITANWTLGTGWTASGGTLIKGSAGTGTASASNAGIVAGNYYLASVTVSAISGGSANWTVAGTAVGASQQNLSVATTYTELFIASANTNVITISPNQSGMTMTISAITVQQYNPAIVTFPGIFYTNSTDGRIVLGNNNACNNSYGLSSVICIGFSAGEYGSQIGYSIFEGRDAGALCGISSNCTNAVFLGHAPGEYAWAGEFGVTIGYLAAQNPGGANSTTNVTSGVVIGALAGQNAGYMLNSVIIGYAAGQSLSSCWPCVIIGSNAAASGTNDFSNSTILGPYAGNASTGSTGSVFIGNYAGSGTNANNKLCIETVQADSTACLISGDFSARSLIFNASESALHIKSYTSPTVAAGGAISTTPTITGSDFVGTVSVPSTAVTTGTIATVTFGSAYTVAPNCWVSQNGGLVSVGVGHGTPGTTSFTITAAVANVSAAAYLFDYGCSGN